MAAFNRLVAQSLSRQFPSVRIVGEVAQLTVASSGHRYLTLRDAQASLRAVIFKGDTGELSCLPSEGQRVEVLASAALYEPRGDFQIRIVGMKPAGQGSLFEAFLRLKALLTAQGLFDPAGRRGRPAHLLRVGVVTSAAGGGPAGCLGDAQQGGPAPCCCGLCLARSGCRSTQAARGGNRPRSGLSGQRRGTP